jgi:hypothetical protein
MQGWSPDVVAGGGAASSGKILNGSPSHPPPPFHNGAGQTDRQVSLRRAYRP